MAPPEPTAATPRPQASTLAEKIDALFRVVRRPNHEQFSHEEVAKACREATGESFSATYLWQLRTGRRDNPTKRHLEALAQFFQVPVAYFFDDDRGAAVAKELELLGALRDAGVRSVALRAVNLSPEGVGTISDMIDVIARRERGGGGTLGPGD
ncbi:helix-turn-helix domain-containing protein [Streptomyces sp. ICBB 8177]|uniref:helix-turn-helix domain-containing protein n=1 Tax=Streptomyces sp. ICBB 8177 TaxID=563922 RepID=UPI000D6819E6|nr:helix-turn-helix domain-containing protein [Streptomyces sp. ICBB 8177]PWI42189.1 transcriptional regulator [Streptomyces sp. ICBB 8177]